MQEWRKGIVSSLLCKCDRDDWYYVFSNDYEKVVRVLAWILRFVSSCRKQRTGHCKGKMLPWISSAKRTIRYVQKETLAGLQDERIASLDSCLDTGELSA